MSDKAQVKWDYSRFLATLNYFGEIPFIGSFRWLQQWLGQSKSLSGMTLSAVKNKVLIVGLDLFNTSESDASEPDSPARSNSHLFSLLQPKVKASTDLLNYEWPRPRQNACLSELQTETGAFRESAKKIPSDLKKMIRAVDTVVLLSRVNQLHWMRDIAACYLEVLSELTAADNVVESLFDFSQEGIDLSAWGSLDDVVMGGVSQGSFFKRGQQAVFAGNVSTDNSGGFSSVRTQNFEPPFNFSGWQGWLLRVKGDGQRYKFIARNSGGWDSLAYIYGVDTVKDEWIEVFVPFEAMVPTFRARSVAEAPAFDPAKVFSFQLMLSKFECDRQLNPKFSAGAFELEVSDISLYRDRQGLPLVVVGSPDEAICAQQRAILEEAGVAYRFIEPSAEQVDEVEGLVDALAQSLS